MKRYLKKKKRQPDSWVRYFEDEVLFWLRETDGAKSQEGNSGIVTEHMGEKKSSRKASWLDLMSFHCLGSQS